VGALRGLSHPCLQGREVYEGREGTLRWIECPIHRAMGLGEGSEQVEAPWSNEQQLLIRQWHYPRFLLSFVVFF